MSNKEIVLEFLSDGLMGGDKAVVSKLIAEEYIQHNPVVPTGRAPLMAFPPIEGTTYRALSDGDMVAVHNEYLWNGEKMAAFDLFRLEDGVITEHWDVMQVVPETTASGRSMFDGPTDIVDMEKTAVNKALVREFIETVLAGGQFDKLTDYINPANYAQHNPQVADGLDALGDFASYLADNNISFGYRTIHHLVGEGNFVLAASEGDFGGAPTAFYDLFRVEDGIIVEHWDVVQAIPSESVHDNGFF